MRYKYHIATANSRQIDRWQHCANDQQWPSNPAIKKLRTILIFIFFFSIGHINECRTISVIKMVSSITMTPFALRERGHNANIFVLAPRSHTRLELTSIYINHSGLFPCRWFFSSVFFDVTVHIRISLLIYTFKAGVGKTCIAIHNRR